MRRGFALGVVLLNELMFDATLRAEGWGVLTARFVYEGTPPKPPAVKITADKEFCCKFNVVDESLVVNEQNGGIANVMVFLVVDRNAKKPPIHASYTAKEDAEVRLDNDKCRYAPHVVVLRTSQTLVIGNRDAISHNTNFTTFLNPECNVLVPPGSEHKLMLKKEERRPLKVACNIHSWMSAWVVVTESPYAGVSDENGRLEIKNLPVGEWTFQAYHEKSGFVREVTQGGSPTKWNRGRLTAAVKPGQNDLGEIRIPASLFQ